MLRVQFVKLLLEGCSEHSLFKATPLLSYWVFFFIAYKSADWWSLTPVCLFRVCFLYPCVGILHLTTDNCICDANITDPHSKMAMVQQKLLGHFHLIFNQTKIKITFKTLKCI